MHCPHCGGAVEEGAKFCIHCGNQIAQVGTSNTVNTSVKENEYVKQGKEMSKQYFSFALRALKNPMSFGRTTNGAQLSNGIISLVLFSLLLPLFTYSVANNVGRGYVDVPIFDVVVKPMFMFILFLAALSGIMFVVTKFMKLEVTFRDVVARFGTFVTVPVFLVLVAVILVTLSIYAFAFLLLFIALCCFLLTITSTIYSYPKESKGGLDSFYGVVLAYIIMIILGVMFGESMLNGLISEIQRELFLF
ncbi:zinc ribbon domain-containing protein [Bacillus sp. FJAT-45350]|uniref:zinc ribbon domain-containing protein n=1 Tax=Bacillus sp. FJAT-45350 TaxID=2011014 RepID=UPI000BB8DBAF|nr:zinc ribbon domain-containing protein [Bacillus sp. FJAT-45350]